uniref:Uncharacterized protein n=1 Tax=Glossina austeni TaxID=7395 RepID=A0A1A9VJF8_GLOAU
MCAYYAELRSNESTMYYLAYDICSPSSTFSCRNVQRCLDESTSIVVKLNKCKAALGRTGMTESNNMLLFFINSLRTYANCLKPKYNTCTARSLDDFQHDAELEHCPKGILWDLNLSSLIQRSLNVLNETICAPANGFNFTAIQLTMLSKHYNLCYEALLKASFTIKTSLLDMKKEYAIRDDVRINGSIGIFLILNEFVKRLNEWGRREVTQL